MEIYAFDNPDLPGIIYKDADGNTLEEEFVNRLFRENKVDQYHDHVTDWYHASNCS